MGAWLLRRSGTLTNDCTAMEWLNYHHLYYFHAVAKEGSIAQVSKTLRLGPATISAQIRSLEGALDQQLFERVGRGLVLTEHGRVVLRYADEIFGLGREMRETFAGKSGGRATKLRVGISDSVPKLIAHQLLAPALAMPSAVHLVARESGTPALIADLIAHALDLVITDAPIQSTGHVRAYNHVLGETGISFFATPTLAKRLRHGFPARLDGAPMLLPADTSSVRPQIDHWLESQGVRPTVVAEFDDSALMKVFGQHGAGVFPGPTMVEREIARQYGVSAIGRTTAVRERFYAITVDRKIKHPVAIAITDAARERFENMRSIG